MKVFCKAAICLVFGLVLTEGRFVIPPQNSLRDDGVAVSPISECDEVLSKTLVRLLISEYNRIGASSQLYVPAGVPAVQCKSIAGQECDLYVDLAPTSCKRSSSTFWFDCQPISSQPIKRCRGTVNLQSGTVEVPLRCQGNNGPLGFPNQVNNNNMQMGGAEGYPNFNGDGFLAEDGSEIMKKKWDSTSGNIQPF